MQKIPKEITVLIMPKINIDYKSSLNPNETLTKVKEVLENDSELRKLDKNYNCEFDEAKLCGTVKSKQFKASINVEQNDEGSLVKIMVDLPFALSLFKGMVEKTLVRKLEKAFG